MRDTTCAAENKKIIEEYYAPLKIKALQLLKSRNALLRKEKKLREKEVSRLQKLLEGQSKAANDLRAKNTEQSERIKALSAETTALRREKNAASVELRAKNAEQSDRIKALSAELGCALVLR